MYRSVWLCLVAASLSGASCADGPTRPEAGGPGLYRLVSVQGKPLPYRDVGAAGPVWVVIDGDLLLRPDGSSALAYRGSYGGMLNGTFSQTPGAITIRNPTVDSAHPSHRLVGRVAGDSIVMRIIGGSVSPFAEPTTLSWVYLRATQDPVAVTSGLYVLRRINQRPVPGVIAEWGSEGNRLEQRLEYDSLTFSDGMFYVQHRRERTLQNGEVVASREWHGTGGYRGNASALTLRAHWHDSPFLWQGALSRDSLSVANGALIRRSWPVEGVVDEYYEFVRRD